MTDPVSHDAIKIAHQCVVGHLSRLGQIFAAPKPPSWQATPMGGLNGRHVALAKHHNGKALQNLNYEGGFSIPKNIAINEVTQTLQQAYRAALDLAKLSELTVSVSQGAFDSQNGKTQIRIIFSGEAEVTAVRAALEKRILMHYCDGHTTPPPPAPVAKNGRDGQRTWHRS